MVKDSLIASAPGPPHVVDERNKPLPPDLWPYAITNISWFIENGYVEDLSNSTIRPISNSPNGAQILCSWEALTKRTAKFPVPTFIGQASFEVPSSLLPLSVGFTASIDSLRLQWEYPSRLWTDDHTNTRSSLEVIWDRLDNLDLRLPWDTRTGTSLYKLGRYARTITFTELSGASATVLVGLYTPGDHNPAPVVVLDINPSKASAGLLLWLLRVLSDGALRRCKLVRYDLAIDMPYPRERFSLLPVSGRHYCKIKSPTGALTEYIGQRQHPGYIKLYDKAAESFLDHCVTRLELTLSPDSDIPMEVPECVNLIGDYTQDVLRDFDIWACSLFPELLPLLKMCISRNSWSKKKKQVSQYRKCFFSFERDDYLILQTFVNGWKSFLSQF